jgi:hypothetical protein
MAAANACQLFKILTLWVKERSFKVVFKLQSRIVRGLALVKGIVASMEACSLRVLPFTSIKGCLVNL